jgi:hypothetical protein
MQKFHAFIVLGLLISSLSVSAQKSNTDSLKLVAKISEDQLRLGKLENEVGRKTKVKNEAADQAQNSADANTNAAEKLSNDPQDKKLARNADNKAGDAKTDARRARKDAARLDDLNHSIESLESKIAKEQGKLDRYTHSSLLYSPPAYMPPLKDSITHQ